MKRMAFLFLALILLVSMVPMSVAAAEIEIDVNGSNCARDAGKLIVYTDEYGDTTGTNFWGAEAIVGSDNRVVSITNGNAEIPEGGFVVSGHDDDSKPDGKLMKTWVQKNVKVGSYVYFDRRTLKLIVSDQPREAQSPFYSFDNPADAVNVVREDNQMILYTPEYGETTGSNEYGYEVVIEDGIVTKLGGNNSVIPKNGCVVSLHGAPARWMRIKIVKGMTVEIDQETLNVVFSYSAEGLKKAVVYSLNKAQADINMAKAAFVYADYAATQKTVDDLHVQYQAVLAAYDKDKDENKFADACDKLIEKADVLSYALCDSYPAQYRGVWIRPSEKSPIEVDRYVKQLHEEGVNFVCIEGWFENGVIMEVPDDCLLARHPSFNYDVLQAYINACHKYGMECHLWMPILCVGSLIHDGYDERTVTGQKPEWLSLNNLRQPYNKDGFMMIDPANDEARAYMLDFYRYIVTKYDIDCFEMDYIRYYVKTNDADFGYTDAAFAGFEEAYGYGVKPKYDTKAEYWDDWCQYRRDCVSKWVYDIREMLDREAPDVLLAADVAFPFEHALDYVYQEFPSWLEDGIIDILHPMAYGDGYGDDIKKAVELGGDTCMVVTGLGAHMDVLGAKELERQARENASYGAYGECYFEAKAYLADKVAALAGQTVYRNEAMPIYLDADASIKALLDYMNGRIDDVIVPFEGVTEAEATALKTAITAAKDATADGKIEATALTALKDAVNAVANEKAKAALLGDVARAERIVLVKANDGAVQAPMTDDATADKTDPMMIVAIAAVAVAVIAVIVAVIVLVPRKKKDDEE